MPDEPDQEAASFQPITGESVAVELRRARQDLGRDLARIADDLKIRRVYLEAIEDGRFDDLPGATYAVGFVRAYAEYLDLDGAEIVGRFKDEVEGLNERLHLVFPTPVPESKIPSGAVLLISVLLIALAYGGWYYFSSRDERSQGQVLDLPKSLEPLASDTGGLVAEDGTAREDSETAPRIVLLPAEPAEQEPTVHESAEQVSAEQEPTELALPGAAEPLPVDEQASDAALPADGTAGSSTVGEDSHTALEAPQDPGAQAAVDNAVTADLEAAPAADPDAGNMTTGPAVAAAPAAGLANLAIPSAPTPEALLPGDESRQPRVYGVENATSRIVLRARLDAWVQVHAADESLLLTRVLQPGDSYRVPDLDGLTLVTGNAGGLDIEVDGATLPPLGPVGAIRRDIALDPDRLLAGGVNAQ